MELCKRTERSWQGRWRPSSRGKRKDRRVVSTRRDYLLWNTVEQLRRAESHPLGFSDKRSSVTLVRASLRVADTEVRVGRRQGSRSWGMDAAGRPSCQGGLCGKGSIRERARRCGVWRKSFTSKLRETRGNVSGDGQDSADAERLQRQNKEDGLHTRHKVPEKVGRLREML